jgi:TonB family protein
MRLVFYSRSNTLSDPHGRLMRITLALIGALLLTAPVASAQNTAPPADAKGNAESSPEVAEAAELTAKVVKLSNEGKYQEALPLAQRALELREKALGREHPLVASALMNVATLDSYLRNFEEAKSLAHRALAIYEKLGGEYVQQQVRALDLLARLEPFAPKAIELHERNLALKEKTYGPDSPQVSTTLFPLAHLNELLGNDEKAEKLFARFIEIREKTKAGADDDVEVAELRMGCLLRKDNKLQEAQAYEAKAKERSKQKLAPIQGGVISGKALSKPAPEYPAEARSAHVEGTVVVDVLVGETGNVLYACATGDANPALKRASEFAAYNARFTPTTLGGKPVKVRGTITYNFVLR